MPLHIDLAGSGVHSRYDPAYYGNGLADVHLALTPVHAPKQVK
jgi:hypothetical protein